MVKELSVVLGINHQELPERPSDHTGLSAALYDGYGKRGFSCAWNKSPRAPRTSIWSKQRIISSSHEAFLNTPSQKEKQKELGSLMESSILEELTVYLLLVIHSNFLKLEKDIYTLSLEIEITFNLYFDGFLILTAVYSESLTVQLFSNSTKPYYQN